MDYNKLDADLSAELAERSADPNAANDLGSASLPIFIQTVNAAGPEEEAFLRQLGVGGAIAGQQIITANLSAEAIAQLSTQPWVSHLKLSRKLRPLSQS